YILKTRRRRVRVASAAMYVVARREAAARDPWKRLTPELALLLQLLALMLLSLAFARPVSKGGALDADAVVVVVDRSASMAARAISRAAAAGESATSGAPAPRSPMVRRGSTRTAAPRST